MEMADEAALKAYDSDAVSQDLDRSIREGSRGRNDYLQYHRPVAARLLRYRFAPPPARRSTQVLHFDE
jgi:hypothetical protein